LLKTSLQERLALFKATGDLAVYPLKGAHYDARRTAYWQLNKVTLACVQA